MSKKPTKTTPVTHAEHFRLRPVTEKPTPEDADWSGSIIVYKQGNGFINHAWHQEFPSGSLCWIPGSLPSHLIAHLIPKPETAEERMRREFEEWAKNNGYDTDSFPAGDYQAPDTQCAWDGWQAAKTTP